LRNVKISTKKFRHWSEALGEALEGHRFLFGFAKKNSWLCQEVPVPSARNFVHSTKVPLALPKNCSRSEQVPKKKIAKIFYSICGVFNQ
jgi:hypothetical protein